MVQAFFLECTGGPQIYSAVLSWSLSSQIDHSSPQTCSSVSFQSLNCQIARLGPQTCSAMSSRSLNCKSPVYVFKLKLVNSIFIELSKNGKFSFVRLLVTCTLN
jgi:hypothetical protein